MEDSIISANTRGFTKNQDKIQKLVDHYKPMTFVANEHKQEDLSKLNLEGYKLSSAFPATNGNRGTAIFVRDDVEFESRPDLDSHARRGEFEMSATEIPSRNLTVAGHYRSPAARPTSSYNKRLDEFLKDAASGSPDKRLVVAGDFNQDTTADSKTKEVLKGNDFKFNVRSPTHEQGRCLDNFATNFSPAKSRVMGSKMATSISDHKPIFMQLPKDNTSSKSAGVSTNGSSRAIPPGGKTSAAPTPVGGRGSANPAGVKSNATPVGGKASSAIPTGGRGSVVTAGGKSNAVAAGGRSSVASAGAKASATAAGGRGNAVTAGGKSNAVAASGSSAVPSVEKGSAAAAGARGNAVSAGGKSNAVAASGKSSAVPSVAKGSATSAGGRLVFSSGHINAAASGGRSGAYRSSTSVGSKSGGGKGGHGSGGGSGRPGNSEASLMNDMRMLKIW